MIPEVISNSERVRASPVTRVMGFLKRHAILACTVIVPTIAAIIYYGTIASDVYISESRFVVRSPQRQGSTSLFGSLLAGTGFSRSQDDTYSVHDYVLSRDALTEIDKKLNTRKAFSSKDVDFFNRFPGLDWDDSFEAFHKYYKKRVTIDYDTVSSITVLTVRAFSAEDAKKTNDLLLTMGERLVNNLNDRSRQDLIKFAEQEVQIAEEKTKIAAIALSSFRNNQSVINPEAQSAIQLQGVARIQDELLAAEAQLAQMLQVSPNNSQVPVMRNRVANLRSAISRETAKVAGGGGSLASKSTGYERLVLEKGFADRQLAAAMASLESARSEALRKQLYLERLVQPNLPDHAMEPRRLRGVLTMFVLGLIAWGVLSLLAASILEHRD